MGLTYLANCLIICMKCQAMFSEQKKNKIKKKQQQQNTRTVANLHEMSAPLGDNLHEISNFAFLGKIRKNINFSSSEFAQRMVKVKKPVSQNRETSLVWINLCV